MKVAKLIKLLQAMPPDADVAAEWDSGWSNLGSIWLEREVKREGDSVVVIDVGDYGSYERT